MSLIERAVRERIVLVGVTIPPARVDDTESSLDELALLIATAGAEEAGRVMQRKDRPDPATFIGKGKIEELLEVCLDVDADTVVFDNELTPAQQYNLEKLLGRTAIDRTAVILDIFAQNAHTLEGKAQVELALLRYRLPRLRRGRTGALSQQAGRHRHPWPGRNPARDRSPAACSDASRSSSTTSRTSATPGRRNGRRATAAGCSRSRSWATRTPASPPS